MSDVIRPAHSHATADAKTSTDAFSSSPSQMIYDLHDPALIAIFYGQRGQLEPLRDHLVKQRQLIQEDSITFSNEETRTLLLHFDSPGAVDTSVIQLALNSTDQVATAWTSLREQLAVMLNDTLLQWPIWGYSLIYQAMLTQELGTDTIDNTMLKPTIETLLPVVQGLHAVMGESLPLLESSIMSGGQVSLHCIPLERDGLEAATVYTALSLPDPTNQLVKQVLLGQGAILLMPDLIAHKAYHQIRQYHSNDWLTHYNQLVQTLREGTKTLLSPSVDHQPQRAFITSLQQAQSNIFRHMQSLTALRISLTQQNENLPWWIEQTAGDTTVFQFHQRHLQMALRDLELLLEKGQTAYDGTQAVLNDIRQHNQVDGRAHVEQLSEDPTNAATFRQLLTTHFSVGELQDLCFDLSIDYESLPGQGKGEKAREIIAYVQRHGRTSDLLTKCQELRPHVNWPKITRSTTSGKPVHHQTQPPSAQQQAPTATPTPDEPLHVTLRFDQTSHGVRITWDSILGTKKSTFAPPYTSQDLNLVIRALDAIQYPNYPLGSPMFSPEEQARLQAIGLWEDKRIAREAPRIVGQKLYAALRRSRSGAEALNVVRETARVQGKPISYVLRFPSDAVELAALPWEALWDERQAVLLSRGGREIDSCERYLDLDISLSPPISAGKKLHILALSPHADIPQQVRDQERAARIKSWDVLEKQGLLTWDEVSPVTTANLDQRMRRGPTPDIVHYYGHGIYKNGQGSLLFDSHTTPGHRELVSAQRLAAILGGIRLIMLFACQSAMVPVAENEHILLTGIAPALSAVSEVVVAMQLTTRISAATQFSEVFYDELARGRSVQAAVADARRSLYVTESDGMSWYVPTLYIRTREQKPIYFTSI